jgi:hypothetical protein
MNYSPENRSSRKFEGISSVTGIVNDTKFTNPRNINVNVSNNV